MSEVGAFQLIKQGNLRVEIHFAEALTANINVVMYAEFDNVNGGGSGGGVYLSICETASLLFRLLLTVFVSIMSQHDVFLEYLSLHTGQVLSSICSVGQTLVT
jgi:hypothetical protein